MLLDGDEMVDVLFFETDDIEELDEALYMEQLQTERVLTMLIIEETLLFVPE